MSAWEAGMRVELAPHTDAWMQGDRYGVVQSHSIDPAGRGTVRVRLDKSKRSIVLDEQEVTHVTSG